MSVALALGAAIAYGLADFIGGLVSQRVTAWAVALVAQVGGALALVVASLAVPGTPTASDFWWAVAAGVANGFGTAFLYRGLSRGRMAVVAPVSGVEPPSCRSWSVLSWVSALGPATFGMVVALPGIWYVAREPRSGSPSTSGWTDGVLAGLGFGSLFVLLAQIGEGSGVLPLALNQIVAAVAVVAVAVSVRAAWVPRRPLALVGAVPGILGGLATIGFLYATHGGYLSVTAVLTSLYPAITVLLAASVLRERIHASQALGLALCAGVVVLVALA